MADSASTDGAAHTCALWMRRNTAEKNEYLNKCKVDIAVFTNKRNQGNLNQ
jgi:hypothetical protein